MKKNHARDSFRLFMERRGLKPHPWAQQAGIRSSTLYNFLSGVSDNLTANTLQKLAHAAGTTVDELLGLAPRPDKVQPAPLVRVTGVIGIYGRMFDVDIESEVERPIGLAPDLAVLAARIDKDGLHPVPGGWLLYYEAAPRDPEQLLNKLAVVSTVHGQQRLVREIRRGSRMGLYTLYAWNAAAVDDVEIETAHAVVSISQTLERPVSPKK